MNKYRGEAHLGELSAVGVEEVAGSNPVTSTKKLSKRKLI